MTFMAAILGSLVLCISILAWHAQDHCPTPNGKPDSVLAQLTPG